MTRERLVTITLFLGLVHVAGAQENPEFRPLFNSNQLLELSIEGPLEQLTRERRDRPELDGVVRYLDSDGNEVVLDVEISSRGNSRLDICNFPPMWLNFRRGQLPGTVFAGQNRLKLVTRCKAGNSYGDYLAQEYQIYRAYNALTDNSFRVRPLLINYVETEGKASTNVEFAFFIEEDWEVAERVGLELIKVTSLQVAQLDTMGAALLSLFQYMIGNTDWSPIAAPPGETCCHNTKLIGSTDNEGGRVVLPYDFDQVGLINAGYAMPPAGMEISSVTQRRYRGYCVLNADLDAAIQLLNERRSEVEAALSVPDVRARSARRLQRFLAKSYEYINDPRRVQRDLVDDCR